MRFLTKRRLVILIISVALLGAFAACLLTLDMLPALDYKVSVSDSGAQMLRVEMKISVPLFSKKEEVFLFLGEKDITVLSCADFWGNTKETFLSDEGIVTVPVSRGSITKIVYDVSVSVPGKHGNRGAIADNYVVFDGEQAFLLPAEFNVFSEQGVRNSAGKIAFRFDFPKDWEEIVPFKKIDNPSWFDIYAVNKNAFVFGKFDHIVKTQDGLEVYALPGQMPEDLSGFDSLFTYYTDLFKSAPSSFSIVLLPSDNLESSVIGGSGTRIVAASFDHDSRRDWQLLSHRLFHAFYDNAAPYMNVHIAPNIWLNEGLATYYENLATDALPESLKLKLGVNVNRQMALTFNQYLYMRFKEPFQYNVAPMDEERITSRAMTEFLHYTTAPLVVKAFEDESRRAGNPPDALLRYCLAESAFKDQYTAMAAALDLLGDKGVEFFDHYMLGLDIPPLWDLKAFEPAPSEILESLNYIETLLANWQQVDNTEYTADLVSMDELTKAMDADDDTKIPVMSEETDANVRGYCPELYALVKDYYRRASQQGFALDDRDLRSKMQKGM